MLESGGATTTIGFGTASAFGSSNTTTMMAIKKNKEKKPPQEQGADSTKWLKSNQTMVYIYWKITH